MIVVVVVDVVVWVCFGVRKHEQALLTLAVRGVAFGVHPETRAVGMVCVARRSFPARRSFFAAGSSVG